MCDHPYLFPDAEDDPDETSVEELVGASGKLRVLDRLLVKLHRAGHRVALFSQFAQARPQRSSASRGCGCLSSWDRRFRGASEHASRASGARDRSISTQRVRPRAVAPDRPDAPTPPAPPLAAPLLEVIDLLYDYCRQRGWRYTRLTGATNRVQRMVSTPEFVRDDVSHQEDRSSQTAQSRHCYCRTPVEVYTQEFNSPGSRTFLFLMTTRAGGLGINLQTADTCVLFDSDWNPQADVQAMARVHRLGQTKPVHVYRLCSGGTAEERVLQRSQKKLYLSQVVNRADDGGEAASAGELEVV